MRAPATIMTFSRTSLIALAAAALGGCVGGATTRFDRPPPSPLPSPVVSLPAPAPVSSAKPTIIVNAGEKRVRDTIIERAQARGTKIIGENTTGVTLEAPLRSTTPRLADICGAHRDGRVVRIYLATSGNGARSTIVTEERFVVDTDNTVCAVVLTPEEVTEATNALGSLKSQAERPATASATPASATTVSGGTSFNPVRR
jgi:hypothetical protein